MRASIEKDAFEKQSFVKNYNIALRTLNRDITFLKEHNLISFEGSRKTGKYKLTEKYRQLKKKL